MDRIDRIEQQAAMTAIERQWCIEAAPRMGAELVGLECKDIAAEAKQTGDAKQADRRQVNGLTIIIDRDTIHILQ